MRRPRPPSHGRRYRPDRRFPPVLSNPLAVTPSSCKELDPQNRILHGPPKLKKISPHRRQGWLLAADRFGCRRGAHRLALGARGRPCQASRRRTRIAGGLVRLDRARAQPIKTAARPAEAGGKPGCGCRGTDRAGADLVGSAGRPRHRLGADPRDLAGYRGTPPLSQRALDHRQASGMARGADHQ